MRVQPSIVILLIVAFVINLPWLVGFVAAVMLMGTALRQPGFKPIYAGLLKPRGIVKPDVLHDNPQPHIFAQGMGGTVLLLGIVASGLFGAPTARHISRHAPIAEGKLMDILLRLGVVTLILFAGVSLYWLWSRVRLHRLRRRACRDKQYAGLEGFQKGIPAILYFTTPDCIPCRTTQGPAIETLREQFRDRLQIIKIDASQRTDLANYWGVLSVPTTFIIDSAGQPRHVNNGVTLAPKLRQQLREFAGLSDAGDSISRSSMPLKQRVWHTHTN